MTAALSSGGTWSRPSPRDPRRTTPLWPALAAGGFVLSWRLGLWLVVVAGAAAAAVAARVWLEERRSLPVLVAARACFWSDATTAWDAEEAMAAEVAVVARGDLSVLNRAAPLVRSERDARTRATALERLGVAAGMVRSLRIPGVRARRPGAQLRSTLAAVAVPSILAGAPVDASHRWLVGLAFAYTVALLAIVERRAALRLRPQATAKQALAEAPPAAPSLPRPSAPSELARIARRDAAALRRVERLLRRSHDAPNRPLAIARIRAATALASPKVHRDRVLRMWWCGATATAAAVGAWWVAP